MKILHVEERMSITDQFKNIFQSKSYDYYVATSFEDADRYINSEEIDVLIVDLNMSYDDLVLDDKKDMQPEELNYGMISGYYWLKKVLKRNTIEGKQCIVYSGYLDVLTDDQKKEVSGVKFIDKSTSSISPTEAVINYVEIIKKYIENKNQR